MHVLIAGAGWLGREVGRALVARGDRVTAVKRSPEGLDVLRGLGFDALALDLADPAAVDSIPEDVTAIVACQAASGEGPDAYRRAYVDVNATLLLAGRRLPLSGYVYTSSTGVFGQDAGESVDEATQVMPVGPGAEALVEAERLVRDAAGRRLPVRVVRLSGLYGPGRVGILDRVKGGALALGPGDDAWMNFCHLEDATATILAALEPGRPAGAIYHASDAFPTRRRDVVTWIAEHLGIEPPRREGAPTLPGGRRGANRRILAHGTRRELGLVLKYPSFREGLIPHLEEAI
ncbi:MAG TPA: NAD-dependent epimerase/dehydratase family protein [Candidatus Polarisedimenticolaceae bacterium]